MVLRNETEGGGGGGGGGEGLVQIFCMIGLAWLWQQNEFTAFAWSRKKKEFCVLHNVAFTYFLSGCFVRLFFIKYSINSVN